MARVNIVYWEEEGAWLGFLQEYPDYWTQGETLEDLKEHLRDLFQDITGGKVPGLRKVGITPERRGNVRSLYTPVHRSRERLGVDQIFSVFP